MATENCDPMIDLTDAIAYLKESSEDTLGWAQRFDSENGTHLTPVVQQNTQQLIAGLHNHLLTIAQLFSATAQAAAFASGALKPEALAKEVPDPV